ncbi:MAG: TetR/AcrR family transcriptional regulator [Lachnospiraceae bacterium]|nr:TetR/AcrR family transcriptional regulator [Lachnospiraceae bacterium]
MDKRKEANLRVKKTITDSLFELMQHNTLDTITITDIIQKAHVARVSFYRNYTSKEDVLVTLVRDILDDYRDTADYDLSAYTSRENMERTFQYFYKYRSYVCNLYRSGYGTMLLEELNQFHESIAGEMPANSAEKYLLYLYMGAIYNTAIVWISEEHPAPLEDMIDTIYHRLAWLESG